MPGVLIFPFRAQQVGAVGPGVLEKECRCVANSSDGNAFQGSKQSKSSKFSAAELEPRTSDYLATVHSSGETLVFRMANSKEGCKAVYIYPRKRTGLLPKKSAVD